VLNQGSKKGNPDEGERLKGKTINPLSNFPPYPLSVPSPLDARLSRFEQGI
jgi:hypothetical protein